MDSLLVKRVLRGLWVVLAGAGLLLAVYILLPLLYPLLLAWLLAYLIHPLVLILKGFKLPGWLAVVLSLLFYIGGTALVLTALITRLVKELIVLLQTFDLHTDEWRELLLSLSRNASIQNIINQINQFYHDNPGYHDTIDSNINRTTETVGQFVTDLITGFFNMILKLVSALPSLGTILIVIVLAAFFLSTGWERHNARLTGLLPAPLLRPVTNIWNDLRKALVGYLRAQAVLISVTAFIVIIGLLLLGVNSAFVIGLTIGLIDTVPYLGVGIIMLPWALYSYMTGNLALAVGLLVLYGIILITRQVLEPKVLASSIGVDPLSMLIGVFAGLQLFGMLGILIGPVVLVILGAFSRAGVFRALHSYIMSGKLH
ncbi:MULTISPECIES: sporulation integral membrane protein YtvI [unclassified Paenibacillus]|uniref:sporulation integral membrane protein YtvI n=1 Tax=unclassified Paenibacillus TaxID=185978 RepID=UPI00240511A4|nr:MULTISPECIES: sporulation integral membrane protein YtvI [unclassified Paenibacillus]MDF9845205.1 sporulation integral membrane protein YtvI [Paenibacillus sp. PastF-2]MDF9851814.1 sporulation integral membrane protein YtvI [Paenibacillus sp. PastM-2]MDF9858371.1 sporulation integral membrane protein YtvI [Paenibacillus sp. PastF-1]MDH6483660.1 sporulation integral membrane protein YtvI [Paenibacillus sp. PastH-2]MDH6511047.1 sporulation integral membrane protein YtvI [Paenibacillus sp. Pas